MTLGHGKGVVSDKHCPGKELAAITKITWTCTWLAPTVHE